MTKLVPPFTLDKQLCFAVYAAEHAYTRLYKSRLKAVGLTYPQYLVMLILWETDDLTVNGIGERLYLDSGTLTPLLRRLEKAGHVERRRDLADERQVRITLTKTGAELKGRVEAELLPALRQIGLKRAEMDELRTELDRLRRVLNAVTDAL